MYLKILIINFLSLLFFIHLSYSQDSIIYSDFIKTDEKNNIQAKGGVKIINGNQILETENVYIDEENNKIILDDYFTFKDEMGNYYLGSKGEFSKDFNDASIQDFIFIEENKLRLIGKKAIKKGDIDIVEKAVITPCRTLKFFGCPFWQIKSQKLIHDKKDFLIYQKNARMEVLNVPVFYTPYSITPSPLRKDRRSGFLYPTIIPFNSTNGFSAKLPYYFNLSEDKELLITPTFFVNNKQDIKYLYNQRTSGGYISANMSTLTDFSDQPETGDTEWLKDVSLSLNIDYNINRNYKAGLNANIQTKGTYLREYDTNNPINYLSSLSTSTYLDGYSIFENDDLLTIETYNFQAVKNDTDNKKIPKVSPVINYSGKNISLFKNANMNNNFLFYHIYRDKNTKDHAYRQTRLNYDANFSYQSFYKNSRIKAESTIQTDFYSTYKKQIGNEFVSEEHVRAFPMTGLLIDNPYINNKTETIYNPKLFLSLNGSNNNTNEISNELTTDNEIDISRFFSVNRYTGNDKFDNGQRIGYGLDIDKKDLYFNIAQGFQISSDSDYGKDVNMSDDFSDILGDFGINNILDTKSNFSYNFRYNPYEKYIYYQNAGFGSNTIIGDYSINYSNADSRSTSLSFSNRESIGFNFQSINFLEYSNFEFNTSYDMILDRPQKSTIKYNYGDECIGIYSEYNKSYFENTPDTLSIGMNFSFIGPVPQSFLDYLILEPLNFSE